MRKLAKAQDSDIHVYKSLTNTVPIYAEGKDSDAKADCKSSSSITALSYVRSRTSTSIAAPSKSSSVTASSNNKISSSSSNKPAWALTEAAPIAASEVKELDDEDELLSFAEGLDFDRLVDGMELESVMDQLRNRISDMEKEEAIQEQRDGASEARIEEKKQLARMVCRPS